MDAKKAIRSRYLDIRRNLPAEEVASKSRLIAERLRALESFRRADTYLCYVSSKDNEVDTHDLIRSLLAEGRTVLVPIAERNGTLLWSRMLDLEEMSLSRFGILEPRPECRRPTRPPEDALVIVPGIAFTRDGYRVGYGVIFRYYGFSNSFVKKGPNNRFGTAFQYVSGPETHKIIKFGDRSIAGR